MSCYRWCFLSYAAHELVEIDIYIYICGPRNRELHRSFPGPPVREHLQEAYSFVGVNTRVSCRVPLNQ